MLGEKYPGRRAVSSRQNLPAAPEGCTHLGLGAQAAETIPHHLREATRPSKVQVVWEVCSDAGGQKQC